MRRIVTALLFAMLICIAAISHAQAENRALIISADHFLSAKSTAPSNASNAKAMAEVFAGSLSPFALIRTESDTIGTLDALNNVIWQTFHQANDSDVSYLYLSTHGFMQEEAVLLLSDGNEEELLNATSLASMLSTIKGQKVIIIDACHSGAFIAKGSSNLSNTHPFVGTDYKVLTSSGADEKSWLWRTYDDDPNRAGSGYFTDMLSMGLSPRGRFGADLNNDGEISLLECYQYVLDSHGASTPRIYPEKDPFVLLRYDREKSVLSDYPLGQITFESSLLNIASPLLHFEFTAYRPTRVAYRIVHITNRWHFNRAPLLYDNLEKNTYYGDSPGALSPGRKARSITFLPDSDDTHGYALLQLLTIENQTPIVHHSHVLAVPRMGGDPSLSVKTLPSFIPSAHEEMPIHISHNSPLDYSANVYDENHTLVARLASHKATRPEQLLADGSTLFWNGYRKDGTLATCGNYYIQITAHYPQESYTASSALFALKESP